MQASKIFIRLKFSEHEFNSALLANFVSTTNNAVEFARIQASKIIYTNTMVLNLASTNLILHCAAQPAAHGCMHAQTHPLSISRFHVYFYSVFNIVLW